MDPLLILDAEGTVMSSKEFGGGGQFWNPYMGVTGAEFGCDENPFDGWLIIFSAAPLPGSTPAGTIGEDPTPIYEDNGDGVVNPLDIITNY